MADVGVVESRPRSLSQSALKSCAGTSLLHKIDLP